MGDEQELTDQQLIELRERQSKIFTILARLALVGLAAGILYLICK